MATMHASHQTCAADVSASGHAEGVQGLSLHACKGTHASLHACSMQAYKDVSLHAPVTAVHGRLTFLKRIAGVEAASQQLPEPA